VSDTVLQFLQRRLKVPQTEIATFASWGVFRSIVENEEGAPTVNAGVDAFVSPTPEIQALSALQSETPTPWGNVRHDAYTFRFAMDYLTRGCIHASCTSPLDETWLAIASPDSPPARRTARSPAAVSEPDRRNDRRRLGSRVPRAKSRGGRPNRGDASRASILSAMMVDAYSEPPISRAHAQPTDGSILPSAFSKRRVMTLA
jgi:hypothetical protein